MDRMERLYALHNLLKARRTPISANKIAERFGWGRATVYRVINELRDYLGAPIPDERGTGFYYDNAAGRFELPGLWFSPAEISALLVFQQLLHTLGPGLLDAELEPFRKKIENLLAGRAAGAGELEKRVRILKMAGRDPGQHFQACANALTDRKRLCITYLGRARNAQTERTLSPQRLTHYRDCWYLDAWCHTRKALRSFAVERIRAVNLLDMSAKKVPEKILSTHFASAYGIFGKNRGQTTVSLVDR